MTRELTLHAPAKINLDLRVLYKRADGYHELRTVFQTISVYDTIRACYDPAGETGARVTGNVEIENNLIERAALLVLEETGSGGRFEFTLEKRVPMGAGLGGGSSDAAAGLLAALALTGAKLPQTRVHALAAKLGSDVPFFLHGGTALGVGRGEEVYPLPAARSWYGVLVTPGIHVSTPDAYRALSPMIAARDPASKSAEFARVVWDERWDEAKNDFEAVVFAQHPEIGEIRKKLARAGAGAARMTGSGSAVFGLFSTEDQAQGVAEQFESAVCFKFVRSEDKNLRT
jgi:4-diphosphocytidyl-2-C-methyl-D-erythritol kinase